MLKALQPAVTMLALFVARLETPSRRLILSVCLIAVGTGLTSAGEVNFNLLGVAMMLGSLCTDSSRLVMTQVLLQGFKFHPGGRVGGPRSLWWSGRLCVAQKGCSMAQQCLKGRAALNEMEIFYNECGR